MIGRFKVLRYGYANDDWTARVNRMIKNNKRKQEIEKEMKEMDFF